MESIRISKRGATLTVRSLAATVRQLKRDLREIAAVRSGGCPFLHDEIPSVVDLSMNGLNYVPSLPKPAMEGQTWSHPYLDHRFRVVLEVELVAIGGQWRVRKTPLFF